jgi:hypothetical protein
MSKELASDDKLRIKRLKPEVDNQTGEKQQPTAPDHGAAGVLHLQQTVGNQAVQRLLAQRSGEGAFELDEGTAGRINQARGGGQALDSGLQRQMSSAMGYDLSNVRVHNSSESDNLNQQLNARAFTTGQDIFFKQGEYNPGSSSGKELIAHELTHVVQQGSGQVGAGGSGMTVNPPGDAYEQEADSVASQLSHEDQSGVSQTADTAAVQREAAPEEELVQEKPLQRQAPPEEELLQEKPLQRQAVPEEELVQEKPLQRQAPPEEELVQEKPLQRQAAPEEELVQEKLLQRQAVPEEELVQEMPDETVQRAAEEEELV